MVNVIHSRVLIVMLSWAIVLLPNRTLHAKPENLTAGSAAYFIENKGQITDQYNSIRTDIDYRLPATGGLNVFVGSGAMHYMWSVPLFGDNQDVEQPLAKGAVTYRMDVILVGANRSVKPVSMNSAGYYERYYTLGLAGAEAKAYKKVIYKNIYPNIDWVLYTDGGKVKYDFIVHPGGDVNDIQLRYEGASTIDIENGKLIANTPFGSITEHAPYTYSPHSEESIESSYKLNGNTMGFEVGEYNGKIVIDPSLEWASYMGGNNLDFSYGISADTGRNVYLVGITNSQSNNIVTSGAFQDTVTGDYDGYIVKYAPGGARQWGTYYGGYGNDLINSMTLSNSGELVFCGVTDTSTTLYTKNAHQSNHGGGNGDAFIAKIDVNGSIKWATYYGGSGKERTGNEFQTDIKTDDDDNIFFVGTTTSDTGIATSGSGIAQTTRGGLHDAFIVKFNTSGVRQWGTYYGGTYDDAFTNVGLDSNGMVYAVGEFESDSVGTSGTFSQYRISSNNSTTSRDRDILIAKFNPATGARIWATYHGGNTSSLSGEDLSRGIDVGDTSYVYVSGSTQNSGGIATSGVAQTTFGGQYDAFIIKLDSNGQKIWGTYCGGSGTDHGGNLVIDEAGNPNMSGRTASSTNISTNDGYQTTKGGGSTNSAFDAMMVIYDKGGSKQWGSYYGGSDNDFGFSIATAGLGHMYICGHTQSTTSIAYSGQQNTKSGSIDAFLAKFTPDTSVFVFQPFTQTVHCQKDSFVLKYGVSENFRSGNSYTVQLSDNAGDFSSPINIGYIQADTPGTVKCGIPSNVSGNGFRLRIIATSPIDTSDDNGVDITINKLPNKPVASNNGPVCSNDTLVLKTLKSDNGVEYTWTGPGSYNVTSYDTTATRTNMNSSLSGNYYVSAELTGCITRDTTSVTIKQAAAKPSIQSNAPLCTGDSLELHVTNYTNGATIKWEGPANWSDTNKQNTGRGNVQTSHAGKYYVILGLNGCKSTDTLDVNIGQRPSPVTASGNSPVCTSEDLNLTANTSTTGVVYNWYGPGNYSAFNTQNPVRTNLQTSHSGDYIVEADNGGCKVTDTVTIVVNQAPVKPNATSNSPLCSGDDLQLMGSNISNGASATWTGPAGYSDSGANRTRSNVQVAHAGNYIFKTEFNNGCAQRDTVTVSVTQSNPLNFSVNMNPGTTVCPTTDLEISVNPKQTAGANYYWTGPGGWTGNADTVYRNNVKYADSGYYKVRVVLSSCSVGEDSVYVNVVDTISAPSLSLPSTVCEGDTVAMNPSHPYITSFNLYVPDGDSVVNFNKFSVLGIKQSWQGRFIVKVQSGGCTAYDTAYINTVKPQPAAPSLTSNTPLCENDELKLTANSTTGGVTYSWQGPSNYTSTQQNPTIQSVTASGNAGYYHARSVLNGCFSTPDSVEVEVLSNPKPNINTSPEVCVGDDIALSLDSNSSSEGYVWQSLSNASFNGSGPSATLSNAQLTDEGYFVVSATAAANGCIGRDTVFVDVIPNPGVPNAYYNEPLCQGDKLDLNTDDTSTNVAYAWSGPKGFTFLEKNAFKNTAELDDAGRYYVTVTRQATVITCSITDTVDVIVKPTPEEPKLSNNGPIESGANLELYLDNPTPNASFKWTGPNNFGSRQEDPILNGVGVEASGSYTLETTLDGCVSSGVTIVIVGGGQADKEELILYPNPNNGKFNVKAKVNTDQIMPFEVITVLGTVVYQDIAQTQNKELEMSIELEGVLPSGVYFFRMMMSGDSREVPFTISR